MGLRTWLGMKPAPIREPLDQPPLSDWVAPRKTCMIAAISRSGSYFLCSQLHETNVLGYPEEFFSPGAIKRRFGLEEVDAPRQAVLARQYGTTANDVTSIKFITRHFRQARRHLRLEEWFPHVYWIWIMRSDRLAQAISWEIADQTQAHTSLMSAQARPVYSASAIGVRLERIEQEELRWRAFFEEKAIEPLILWYDDLIAEPAAVVQKVAQFVGEDLAPTSDMPQRPNPLSGMAVQRNEINQSWQRRFRMERNVGLRKPLWKLVHRRRLQKSNDRL